ncbi:hypothetical protein FKM82_017386 [Ascaphus truei]
MSMNTSSFVVASLMQCLVLKYMLKRIQQFQVMAGESFHHVHKVGGRCSIHAICYHIQCYCFSLNAGCFIGVLQYVNRVHTLSW